MEFTNKLNYPQYIVDWLIHDDYDHNYNPLTISATTMMKPTRAHLITVRHREELETDVSDRVAASVGSAIHDSIEKVRTENVQKEQRALRTIMVGDIEYEVTGKYDILEHNEDGTVTLRDVKTTSVWAFIYGGKDDDYRLQLSVYRWLLSLDYSVTDHGFIDFFFTDWQSSKAKQDNKYPQQRIAPGHRIELMSLEEIEEWILSRLELIEANKDLSDDDLPGCTREELWMSDDKFAVMKRGGKRATKLCDTRQEAETYMRTKKIAGFIQDRPAKVRRCNYCAALPFCNQGQSYKNQRLLA